MTDAAQQLARALIVRGISGSVSADGLTVMIDEEGQLEVAAEVCAKFFPEAQVVCRPPAGTMP